MAVLWVGAGEAYQHHGGGRGGASRRCHQSAGGAYTKMEEIGDRTTVFEFGGLRDRQRDYIDWVLKASLDEGVAPDDVPTDEAATLLAAKLKTLSMPVESWFSRTLRAV